MTFTLEPGTSVESLRELCAGFVTMPDDPEYDAARVPWNVAVDQRPAAVAAPETVEQIARTVRAARALGLRISVQGTGHGAGALGGRPLDDVVLIRTSNLRGVYVDLGRSVARVECGAWWQDVVDAAAPHGLAALHGSSPDVGVVGYSLGGGLSWYARKLGLACNSIVAVELVTAQGEIVRVDAESDPDLFWAVRGGGGSFGVVTALELQLFPLREVFAGMLVWDIEHADRVVRAWAQWCATAPEEATTSLRVMRFPPLPELPDFLRGRNLVIIDGAVLGDEWDADAVIAPLRALGPEMDTFATIPAPAMTAVHMDPPGPTPSVGAGVVLDRLDSGAIDAFLGQVGRGVETAVFMAELRQLGGALSRAAAGSGALAAVPGSHVAFFVAIAATPELARLGREHSEAAVAALSPWTSGRHFLNLAERPVDTSSAFEESAWARLRRVRAAVDPGGLFVAGHEVPVGS
ncbi:MAG TPA: FAD-binding oxidoreductase [Nocardioidaceae bacterium]|nr:FAD-binding oxidoreductase [Nocardioidaceae bacterium]